MNDDQGETWRRDVDVIAGIDGRITDQFNLPDWFVATYLVTASGPLSGIAQTTFTDGNVKVRSDSGRHFGVSTTVYDGAANFTGAADTTDTGTADANGLTIGVGNSESFLVTANLERECPICNRDIRSLEPRPRWRGWDGCNHPCRRLLGDGPDDLRGRILKWYPRPRWCL